MQRHQEFQRRLARQLRVDAAGLATMEYLLRTGPTGPTDVARRLDISTAATTLVLDRLQAAGHLTRSPHASDRRKVLLTPAPRSAAAAQGYVDPLLRAVDALTVSLTASEQAVVANFLDRLTAVYDRAVADLAVDPAD